MAPKEVPPKKKNPKGSQQAGAAGGGASAFVQPPRPSQAAPPVGGPSTTGPGAAHTPTPVKPEDKYGTIPAGPRAPGNEDADPPPKPDWEPPEGYEWFWDEELGDWRMRELEGGETAEETAFKNDLLARINDLLGQFDLNTPGLMQLAKDAIANGWGMNEFMLELRRHPDYLAKPMFAANIERARNGKRFMSEGEVLNYSTDVKNLAKRFGYAEPSDAYVAQGFLSGKSIAEYQHHLSVQERVKTYGAGVGLVYKEITGEDPTDQDLHEIFDPEKNTSFIDKALRQAELRGRPFTLGLGIRTEAEARALEMLGISPDEAFSRYQQIGANASRFDRLRSIEDMISSGLPNDFGSQLGTQENSDLVRAFLFNGTAEGSEAFARLQNFVAREAARFSGGGGAAGGGQGLLALTER